MESSEFEMTEAVQEEERTKGNEEERRNQESDAAISAVCVLHLVVTDTNAVTQSPFLLVAASQNAQG